MFKKIVFCLALSCFLVSGSGCAPEQPAAKAEMKLDTPKSRISYTIGLNIGKDFSNQEMDIDPDILLIGIKDSLEGREPKLSEEEMIAEVQAFQTDMQTRQTEKIRALAEKNLAESEAFLAENAKQEGVVVLGSGLQYKVIEPGSGKSPTADSTVTVHYRGSLVDGTEFDSSYSRNEPATFPVSGVIPGWTEALPLMKEGAKWQLVIPPQLAYGERGAGNTIGPNAALVFDVELISIAAE
jgi:FKBP-type peptidyl-prolyl cis-trans isomerase FklB